jgi:hypothetical protein
LAGSELKREVIRFRSEEFAQRGDEVYEREIRPIVEIGHSGEVVAIDIETGAYEVDADEMAASDRLLTRLPDAQIWLRRIGRSYLRRFGYHPQSNTDDYRKNQ